MFALREALSALPDGVFADLLEGDEAYLVVIDLPGVTPDRLDLSVSGGRLAIEATRAKAVPEGFEFIREDRRTFFDIELPLPPDATGEAASGSIDGGVLELRLPKRAASGRSIPVE